MEKYIMYQKPHVVNLSLSSNREAFSLYDAYR